MTVNTVVSALESSTMILGTVACSHFLCSHILLPQAYYYLLWREGHSDGLDAKRRPIDHLSTRPIDTLSTLHIDTPYRRIIDVHPIDAGLPATESCSGPT